MPTPLIAGTLSSVYKTCGKKNCKCSTGDKHGPYLAIQFTKNGKHALKMLNKENSTEISKKVQNYKKYQDGLARINKLNSEINDY